MSTRAQVLVLSAFLGLACIVPARADGPVAAPLANVEDALVARLLDAPWGQHAALEAAVGTRGEAGRVALERARFAGETQRGWLAEAYATRAATRGATLPELKAAFERASRVLRVMLGAEPEDPDLHDLRHDLEDAARRRAADAIALLAAGEPRALPWVELLADELGRPPDSRLACARALVVRKVKGAVRRLERAVDEGDPVAHPNEIIDEVGAFGTVEAVPLLVRALADRARVGDGGAPTRAQRALDALRGVPGFAEAYSRPLERVRRFEAEESPLRHSTGALVSGGWQARRTRDGVEHMIYGPYANDLPQETLHARFRFRIDDAGTTKDGAYVTLEVTSQQMEHAGWPIQSHHAIPQGTPVGEWLERDLVFFPHPNGSKMEFRVRWHGTCDATVDRIDLLRTLPRTEADRALDPPRATRPWAPPPSAAPLTKEAGLALLAAALMLPTVVPHADAWPSPQLGLPPSQPNPGPWRVLRDVLLAEPVAREVLVLAAADPSVPERAWLARAWRHRLENLERWDQLANSLDMVLNHALTPPPWRFRMSGGHPRRSEADLAAGRVAVAIEVIAPQPPPTGLRWLGGPGGVQRANPGMDAESPVLLPTSPLWPSIFAETWLLGWRGPLPAPPNRGKKEIAVVPSTVGILRLHALQKLAWLGEGRILPALKSLAADPAATPDERGVAARLRTAFPK